MEHSDFETSDETVTALADEGSLEDLFGTLGTSVSASQKSSAHRSDDFMDTFTSATPAADQCLSTTDNNDTFFSLDATAEESTVSTHGQQTTSKLTTTEKATRAEGVSTTSSFFDDLLDFSSLGTSEMDQIVLANTANPKAVPTVDLLFGVDDDLVSPTGFQTEVKAKAPDILDFVDVSTCDLPEITSMDVTDGVAYESLTDGWDLLTDVSSLQPGLDQSPDIVATYSGLVTVHDTTVDDTTVDDVTITDEKDNTDGAAQDKRSDNKKHTESAHATEQKIDDDIKEKTADVHHTSSGTDKIQKDNFQDIDFSVLELPGASNLNFDHVKHKRNISQKGSMANRKKPKRSTIQPVGEDNIFLDSTEPKPQKPENEDIPDSKLSLHHSKGDKAQEMGGQLSEETSPTRKLAGGIKIPGLLEGLSKSKAFTRAEKTSPVAEMKSPLAETKSPVAEKTSPIAEKTSPIAEKTSPIAEKTSPIAEKTSPIAEKTSPIAEKTSPVAEKTSLVAENTSQVAEKTPPVAEKTPLVAEPESKAEIVNLNSAANKEKPPATLIAVSSPAVTSSPPLIRPKPVALPRVLPKPTTKTLKESQNQITASGIAARASSFRHVTSASGVVDKPPFLASPVALSRSASVKVTNTSTSKDVELSALKEEKPPSVPISKLVPPKPELKKPLSPAVLRSVNKTPPPVPVKPSVAAKPGRASLGWSSSFSGGKPPLLPALKTKTVTSITKEHITKEHITKEHITIEHTSDPGLIPTAEKKSDSTNTVSTEKKYVSDNKPFSTGFSSDRKPLSFVQKNTEVPQSLAASKKTDATVEVVKPAFGETTTHKNATVNRFPSVRTSLPTGFVARTGFKAGENYANLEAKKADNLDADDVFDASTDKSVDSVSIPDPSSSGDKFDNANNVDEVSQRRKSSISGITPVKSPLTTDKFPASVMQRKGSITGSAYNPIGFRSALGSSDSDQRSRASSVSSSADGVVVASDSANLPAITTPSPKPRTDSNATSEDHKSRNGSLKTSAGEEVRSSPDKFLEGGPDKVTKSEAVSETKLISNLQPYKGDDKKREVTETKNDGQKPPKTFRDSTSPGHLNGSPVATRGGLAADKSTSPWNVQLKKVEKKESPKPEPAVKTEDSQPGNWRQQLSVRQKSSVPPKITEKPKQDNTPEWAKASMKRRQRLIESGVIKGDS